MRHDQAMEMGMRDMASYRPIVDGQVVSPCERPMEILAIKRNKNMVLS